MSDADASSFPRDHNNPPTLAEEILARLPGDLAKELERSQDLIDAVARLPETIGDEVMSAKYADFCGQIKKHERLFETKREAEKAPVLAAGRAVDAWFKTAQERLLDQVEQIDRRQQAWLERQVELRKAEELRRAEEAAAAEAAARKAAQEAIADGDLEQVETALNAAHEHAAVAAMHEERAAQKPVELGGRSRGMGAVSSLVTTWTFSIESIKTIPLAALRPYLPRSAIEQAIRGFIKAGGRELKGVKIYQENTVRTR